MGVKQAGNFSCPWGNAVYGDWRGLSVLHRAFMSRLPGRHSRARRIRIRLCAVVRLAWQIMELRLSRGARQALLRGSLKLLATPLEIYRA